MHPRRSAFGGISKENDSKDSHLRGATMSEAVDGYIAEQPEEVRPILEEFRAVIRKNAPAAEESIRWGMPTYRMKTNVIHFAAQKKHVGLYPGPDAVTVFSQRLSGYEMSKGTIRFPYDKPVPFDIVAEIVRYQVDKQQ